MSANVKLHARRYMRINDAITLTRDGQSLTALVDFFEPGTPSGSLSDLNRIDIAADITTNRGELFWTGEGEFYVYWDDQQVASCTIGVGECAVSLPAQ